MRPGRVCMRLCAAFLLVVTAAESMAAVAPGTPIRVTTTRRSDMSADRFEGQLVSAADPLVMVTSFAGDTLRIGYDEIAKVETGKRTREKRSMAGTAIGAVAVAKSPADGYNFLLASDAVFSLNGYLYSKLPYDPVKDFAPIALVTRASGFLVLVNPSLPVKNVPELVAYAKANPSKLSYAVDTSNIYVSLAGRMLARTSGTEIVEIPYKSIAQALQDAQSMAVRACSAFAPRAAKPSNAADTCRSMGSSSKFAKCAVAMSSCASGGRSSRAGNASITPGQSPRCIAACASLSATSDARSPMRPSGMALRRPVLVQLPGREPRADHARAFAERGRHDAQGLAVGREHVTLARRIERAE